MQSSSALTAYLSIAFVGLFVTMAGGAPIDDLELMKATQMIASFGKQHQQQRSSERDLAIDRTRQLIYAIAERMVSRMDLSKLLASNICPDLFTPEMCRQGRTKGAFYVWLRELRQRALIKQMVEETAKKLERKLIEIHSNDPKSLESAVLSSLVTKSDHASEKIENKSSSSKTTEDMVDSIE